MAEVSGMTIKKDGSLLWRRKCLSESKCNAVFTIDGMLTVEPIEKRIYRYNGTAMNGNPPLTKSIFKSLENFFFIFYIGNNNDFKVIKSSTLK
jgi:hypothetical protein